MQYIETNFKGNNGRKMMKKISHLKGIKKKQMEVKITNPENFLLKTLKD